MQPQTAAKPAGRIALPSVPVLAAGAARAALLTTDGEVRMLPPDQAQMILQGKQVMLCHAPYTRARLGLENILAFDVLELFAFVHPATFCVPTPAGLAKALGLPPPASLEDYPFTLMEAAQALLSDLRREPRTGPKSDPLEIARVMGLQGKGWPWAPYICEALGESYDPAMPVIAKVALNVWKHMPEWAEQAPPAPPAHYPVSGAEARERLTALLGPDSEKRAEQMAYTEAISDAFAPRDEEQDRHIILAEAGTGVGKTLGYLAPASVWAEKNDASVWIATYTKALQRQIDRELDRLYPDPSVKNRRVAIRKGRENYLCLLNLDEMTAGAALAKDIRQMVAAGLMARWAERSRDGDLQGGDFPGDQTRIGGLGECLLAGCGRIAGEQFGFYVERRAQRENFCLQKFSPQPGFGEKRQVFGGNDAADANADADGFGGELVRQTRNGLAQKATRQMIGLQVYGDDGLTGFAELFEDLLPQQIFAQVTQRVV